MLKIARSYSIRAFVLLFYSASGFIYTQQNNSSFLATSIYAHTGIFSSTYLNHNITNTISGLGIQINSSYMTCDPGNTACKNQNNIFTIIADFGLNTNRMLRGTYYNGDTTPHNDRLSRLDTNRLRDIENDSQYQQVDLDPLFRLDTNMLKIEPIMSAAFGLGYGIGYKGINMSAIAGSSITVLAPRDKNAFDTYRRTMCDVTSIVYEVTQQIKSCDLSMNYRSMVVPGLVLRAKAMASKIITDSYSIGFGVNISTNFMFPSKIVKNYVHKVEALADFMHSARTNLTTDNFNTDNFNLGDSGKGRPFISIGGGIEIIFGILQ